MASVDDYEELIATRKLNGLDDGLYESDKNVANMTEEAFNEIIDNFEVVAYLTEYGRRGIKENVKRLQKENEELKFQIKGLKQGMETLEKQLEKKAVSEEKSTSIQEIKTTLQNLTKGQKKRIKSIYGSCVFHSMPDAILRAVWKNSEIQRWIQQNKPNYI